MRKLFEKYLDFSANENMYLKAKLDKCKTVEEAFELLAAEGWALSAKLVAQIRADKSNEKELEEAKEAKAKAEAEAQAIAAAEKAKAEAEAAKQKEAKINDKQFD